MKTSLTAVITRCVIRVIINKTKSPEINRKTGITVQKKYNLKDKAELDVDKYI